MRNFRVIFTGDRSVRDVIADRIESSERGVRLYRVDSDGVEQEVAYFDSGSYVDCFELASGA